MVTFSEAYNVANAEFQAAVTNLQMLEDDARQKYIVHARLLYGCAPAAEVLSARTAWLEADRAAKHARVDTEHAYAKRNTGSRYL